MPSRKLPPVHPGEILLEEFMKPLGISQNRLARDLHVPPRRINEIVHGLRSISADTALRLTRHFGTTAEFWINLQARYDLEVAKDALADRIKKEVQVNPSVNAARRNNLGCGLSRISLPELASSARAGLQ